MVKKSKSLGIFHMVIAALAFSTMTAFVKFACETLPPFQIVFYRSLIGSLMIAAVIVKRKGSFLGTNRKMLVLRGLFGFIALMMNFYAIGRLHLGTAVILNSTSPIFVAIFAALLLKERISIRLWILTFVCFSGVYFLAGPDLSVEPAPILIGLLSGVMAALAFVTISMARAEESSYTIILYFTVISTLGSFPFVIHDHVSMGLREWLVIGGISITSFFGQIYVTKSLREAPASVVSPFNYLMPIGSFVYGFLFWSDSLTPQILLGAFLIIGSGIMIYRFEKQSEPFPD